MATPEGASAWGTVHNQLTAEGSTAADIAFAQSKFSDTLTQLAQVGVNDASSALNYAQQATLGIYSVASAVSTVGSFVSAVESETPVQAANMFTGVMVSLLIAAGSVSAGAGAIIVAGAAIAFSAIQGLLGSKTPRVANVCGASLTWTPSLVVGCVYSNAASPIAVGAANWRSFPIASTSSNWYSTSTPSVGGSFPWVTWKGYGWGYSPWGASRLIDATFPDYAAIENFVNRTAIGIALNVNTRPLSPFIPFLFSAWKANKEYALNGLQPRENYEVLVQAVRFWNRAHAATSYLDITASSTSMPYVASLMPALFNAMGDNDSENNIYNGALRINTGAQYVPKKVIVLHLGLMNPTPKTTIAAPTTSSTAATVAKTGAYTIGGLTVAAVVAGWAVGKGADFFLGRAWTGLKGIVEGSYADVSGALETGARRNPIGASERRRRVSRRRSKRKMRTRR